ncbi:hypothetical protein MRX96_059646 [Rhipicephalus microplus]
MPPPVPPPLPTRATRPPTASTSSCYSGYPATTASCYHTTFTSSAFSDYPVDNASCYHTTSTSSAYSDYPVHTASCYHTTSSAYSDYPVDTASYAHATTCTSDASTDSLTVTCTYTPLRQHCLLFRPRLRRLLLFPLLRLRHLPLLLTLPGYTYRNALFCPFEIFHE